uniref:EOG090X06E3 n=1 Tax=Lynceus sp. MCZ IZ 141354 TaxID=1930659 RepID=A0A9N6WT07_9CRUS|nr:EOG090X06E3 [Lynceus sp. MCZ IZ 141354]
MSYTCTGCHVVFKEADLQREHYKTDWHRYNLKRKVADLPPVTAEGFQQRVLAQRAQAVEDEAAQNRTPYCEACKKRFGSDKSYVNHLNSHKHQENALLAAQREPSTKPAVSKTEVEEEEEEEEVEEVDSDEWEEFTDDPIPVNKCLFCSKESKNLDDNLIHMTKMHGFFVPDAEFVTDMEGLIGYLGAKVGQGHLCLWCGHKGRQFHSVEAVQKHMFDKGHGLMFHESEVLYEYDEFYDYSTSYPDQGDVDEEVKLDTLDSNGFQLVLPSGAVIGHRSLVRYYRQKLNPNPAPAPRPRRAVTNFMQYRALGWTSTSSKEIIERKARDMKFMRKVFSKHYMNLGIKANRLQQHYRPQVDF